MKWSIAYIKKNDNQNSEHLNRICSQKKAEKDSVRVGKELVKRFPEWSEPLRRTVSVGSPYAIGMTHEEAELMFGKPDKVNSSLSGSGLREQWIYREFNDYLYIQNGKVTSFSSN